MTQHSYQKEADMKGRFRMLRKAHGLSQDELGRLTGLTQHTISDVETGRREPYPKTVRTLAEFYGVSVPYLMGLQLPAEAVREQQKVS